MPTWSFEQDVIDRLARLETKLNRVNGAVTDHTQQLAEHSQRLDRAHGAAGAIALVVAGLTEAGLWLLGKRH